MIRFFIFLQLIYLVFFSQVFCQVVVASEKYTSVEAAQLERLKSIGYGDKPRVYLRIFKEEKVLEIWVRSSSEYKLYRSYDICKYSGELGPKLEEGDKQSPEGFYHVPADDVIWNSAKWPRSLNLSFPNVFDALKKRTGSYLLIHGGCSSIGCYALDNGPMEALYAMVSIALKSGQKLVPIHIFPFRLNEANWERHKGHGSVPFWKKLQPVYDHFNQRRKLPLILVCATGYHVYRSGVFDDDAPQTQGGCMEPLPIGSVEEADVTEIAWVSKLSHYYKTLLPKQRAKADPAGQIKVSCNLKRPSCKKWLAMRKKMLKRGVLPKSLLK